jgi:hypothetical protein
VVAQADSVLLAETVCKSGPDTAISTALTSWRKRRAVHDPGKILLDVALTVALGGDCLADVGMLRAEPAMFGPVASDPTISRLVDALATSGPKALAAIRGARSDEHRRVRELAGASSPAADGEVIVDLDGVLVLAHPEKQDTTAPRKKTFGHRPLLTFVDHAQAGPGSRWRPCRGPATPAPTPPPTTSKPPDSPWPSRPNAFARDGRHRSAPTPAAAPTPSSTGSPGAGDGCRIPSE